MSRISCIPILYVGTGIDTCKASSNLYVQYFSLSSYRYRYLKLANLYRTDTYRIRVRCRCRRRHSMRSVSSSGTWGAREGRPSLTYTSPRRATGTKPAFIRLSGQCCGAGLTLASMCVAYCCGPSNLGSIPGILPNIVPVHTRYS